ncbi:MAG TPA: diaminopimelate decarboxylase [Candidatus Tyrphobacter sp.]
MNFGGIPAQTLADRYGTPLLVLDLDALDAAITRCRAVCDSNGVEIAYAGKALLLAALARFVDARGLALDVCSLGELLTAERGGVPAGRITLHGCGKCDDELLAAAEGRVGRIVVDGVEELERLTRVARTDAPVPVLLRLNPGIEAHTHAFVRTGGQDTKFGIAPRDEARARALLRDAPALRFLGLHAHVGSQVYETGAFVANAEALIQAAARFAHDGLVVEEIVVGGGFGVTTHPDRPDERIDFAATIASIAAAVRATAARVGVPPPRIGIEPGRMLVGPAGKTLYRVCAVKRQARRTFVVVDGGLFENPRPALYGAYHHAVAASRANLDLHEVVLCGRSCENDELGRAMLPRELREGDLVALEVTGAYTYSMASNYNRFARPAVIGIEGGKDRLLARRESLEDVLRNDVIE